jgi:uncharacterized protein (DUF2235 family)
MKRIVILIDGTWNDEKTDKQQTNPAELSRDNKTPLQYLIRETDSHGITQIVKYHPGPSGIAGGAIGAGLKRIVQEGYDDIVDNYEPDDEIYLLGFSRGAYGARALAALINTAGIRRKERAVNFDTLWEFYRVRPDIRRAPQTASETDKRKIDDYLVEANGALHISRTVKCVAVWDTVGSYGIPSGLGLARYLGLPSVLDDLGNIATQVFLGFHSTELEDNVDFGLHAIALDEKRNPFPPTFWTAPSTKPPRGHVEQTWFAGVHCDIGGGYPGSQLSDVALIWIIARLQALTGLQFDNAHVVSATAKANIDGEVHNNRTWPAWGWLDRLLMTSREVLPSQSERINERVHWSVIKKLGRPCRVFGEDSAYNPENLRGQVPKEKIAAITPQEAVLLPQALLPEPELVE